MIKQQIITILTEEFDESEAYSETVAVRICEMIEHEIEQGFKTVLQVRLHGIPG